MDENDGDEENKMVGKAKRSRLEEYSPGNCSSCLVCPCLFLLDVA